MSAADSFNPFEWPIPAGLDEFMPTRDEARAAMIRTLAGPYAGPNRVAIAAIITDRYLELRDKAGYPPFKGDDGRRPSAL